MKGLSQPMKLSLVVTLAVMAGAVIYGAGCGTGIAEAACVVSAPTESIVPVSSSISVVPGNVSYAVTVTNKDTSECPNATFTLSKADTNVTNFSSALSVTTPNPCNIAPGGSCTATLTVNALGGAPNGAFDTTTVTAAALGHTNGARSVTTDVNTAFLQSGDGYLLNRSRSETCHACHKTDSNAPTDANSIKTHNSSNTGSTKWSSNWGTSAVGSKYGAILCTTCHTVHNTSNIYLTAQSIRTPDGSNWGSSGTASVSTDFRVKSGTAGVTVGTMGDDTGGHTSSSKVCEVCHSITGHHRYNTTGQSDGLSHYNAQDCTGCHSHKVGFKAGESGGGSDCSSCHSDLYNPMHTGTTSYHHYLNDAGSTPYPTNPSPAATDKRCIQCHVDHNIFRPDLNASNAIGRSANLRTNITVTPPAPPTAIGYTNTDFVSTDTDGGICLSCHKNVQAKSATQKSDGTTNTPVIPFGGGTKTDYQNSPHQYVVQSTFGKDSSLFNANCLKCHSSGGSTVGAQTSTNKFGDHDSALRRIEAPLGITSPTDPLEQNFCYRCHSRTSDSNPGGGTAKTTANRDWYGIQVMSNAAELIYNVIHTLYTTFRHNVEGTTGIHKPYDEGRAANDGTLSGLNRHISCEDCHNPHSAAAPGLDSGTLTGYAAGAPDTLTDTAKTWTANQWAGYTVRITAGTGAGQESVIYRNAANTLSAEFVTALNNTSKYMIYKVGTSDGNTVTPAQKGVWGVAPTWPAQPTPPSWNDSGGAPVNPYDTNGIAQFNAIVTWNRTENATTQGAICIKCHSYYAFGATLPNTPSGLPNSTTTAWGNTVGGTMSQGDKANEFNPNNLSHHAVFGTGKNQPIPVGGTEFKSGTATAGTTTTISDTTSSPFTGSLGKTVLIVSGTGQGQARRITTVNSVSQVTIAPSWTAPASGSKYIVLNSYNANWPFYNAAGTGTVGITTAGVATFTGATLPGTVIPGWYIFTWNDNTWRQIAGNISSANTSFNVSPVPASTVSNSPFIVSAGLGNNFVPPFGPWSTIRCSDCHESDTTTDPMGPHGSATKYLLKKAVQQTFRWMSNNTGTITNITYNPTATYSGNTGGSASGPDTNNFCLNCHRMDVYGAFMLDPSNSCTNTQGLTTGSGWGNPGTVWPYNSRQTHSADCGNQSAYDMRPKWGIHCMNCHGGARAGGIHGQNLGRGNGAASGISYSGRRLLGGSTWYAALRSSQVSASKGGCWAKANTDAVDNCNHGHTGTGGGATQYQSGTVDNVGSGLPNYDYESTNPTVNP